MPETPTTGAVEAVAARALEELSTADDSMVLERWRVSYLGRRGELTSILRGLGSLPAGGAA